jgi:acyl carrier protein
MTLRPDSEENAVIEDEVRQFIVEELSDGREDEPITKDYPLLERQVLDSLGLFQLVGFLESEFGIQIDDEELVPTNFGTIGEIARFVEVKRA